MKYEDHIKAYEEHRDSINWAIDRGLIKSQRIISIHSSRALIELVSAYLHKEELIKSGFQINHRWFKTEKVKERFPDFPNKTEIIAGIIEIELKSENLIYGAQKKEEEIKEFLKKYNSTEKKILNLLEIDNEAKTE